MDAWSAGASANGAAVAGLLALSIGLYFLGRRFPPVGLALFAFGFVLPAALGGATLLYASLLPPLDGAPLLLSVVAVAAVFLATFLPALGAGLGAYSACRRGAESNRSGR